MAIGGFLGTDGNQVLVLREPVDRIEEQIAIVLQAGPLIGGEVGIPDHDQARILFTLLFIARDSERKGSGRVRLGIELHFLLLQIGNREALLRSLQKLDVLDVRRSLYQSDDLLAGSDQAVSLDLITVYKALGGGWESLPQAQALATAAAP